jgi:hypothetical protein
MPEIDPLPPLKLTPPMAATPRLRPFRLAWWVAAPGHLRTLGSGRFRAVYRAVVKFKDGRLRRRYHWKPMV